MIQGFSLLTLNSKQFMTLKVSIFSVVGSESRQTEISPGILCAHGQLPADLNYNAAEPEKGKEVDCMEPFNSAVLLCHSNTLLPLWLRQIATQHSGRHLVHTHTHTCTDTCSHTDAQMSLNVSLQVSINPLGGALKSFLQRASHSNIDALLYIFSLN